jgi:hypothetical protein
VASRVDDSFVVAIDIPFGEEKDQVVDMIVVRLRKIADVLSTLKSEPAKERDNG